MANYKRGRPRTQLTHSPWDKRLYDVPYRGAWLRRWPRWWDVIFHTRPWRRREKALLRAVQYGWIDADEAAWPVLRKPHKYFW